MLTQPEIEQNHENIEVIETTTNDNEEKENLENRQEEINSTPWYYFTVRWVTEYLSKFGEQCLPFQKTACLSCLDNTPLNKARNWNELDEQTGQELCKLIDDHFKTLQTKVEEKLKQQESKLPPPFIKPVCNVNDFTENWSELVKKVRRELGAVLLACPFGSQRYNLNTEHSDMDMFVVYQSDTKSLLGFDKQPAQTVKSSDRETLDYTIHEVYRYGELLLAGDHRCVETLFLHESSYVESSEAINQLLVKRHMFLNSQCLEKYLRDALGSKGLKLFEKWTKDKGREDLLTERESKLAYIIIRLLQNAKNIVDGEDIQVYRPEDSPERQLLMSLKTLRNSQNIQYAMDEINRLKVYIEDNKVKVPDVKEELKRYMNEWIVNLRKCNFC